MTFRRGAFPAVERPGVLIRKRPKHIRQTAVIL